MQVASTRDRSVRSAWRLVIVSVLVSSILLGMVGCATPKPEKNKKSKKPKIDPKLKKLAERAEKAMAQAGKTPGREYANMLRSKHMQRWLKYFKGKRRKPSWPNKKKAVRNVNDFVDSIEAGATWPAPGKYVVPFTTQPPEIDGSLDDEGWDDALTFTEIYPFNSTEQGGPETTIKVLWDKEYLYFGFDCEDTDVVAKDRKRDGHVYFDDCVEMFLLPDMRYRVYWELVIAPNGSIFDAVNTKKPNKWGPTGDPTKDMRDLKTAQKIQGTLNNSDDKDEGYTVEVAVPFSDLPGFTRYPPRPGDEIKGMLVRLDKTQGKFKTYAFRPLQAWGHNIWNHAVFELER